LTSRGFARLALPDSVVRFAVSFARSFNRFAPLGERADSFLKPFERQKNVVDVLD
jgi:hypothetical protein